MGWLTKQDCLNAISTKYGNTVNYCNSAWANQSSAQLNLNLGWIDAAIQSLIDASEDNTFAAWNLMVRNTIYTPSYAVPYYLTHYVNGDLTMAGIISAMFQASDDELLNFIGLNDAYRQSLWNKPFNEEFWTAIARGFEQWG